MQEESKVLRETGEAIEASRQALVREFSEEQNAPPRSTRPLYRTVQSWIESHTNKR